MSNEIENHRRTSREYLSCDISSTQNSLYFVMNQRPFISSNLNIYDETRCIFSSSFIGGQPVVISQEQNRKTCDTIMTSITSNQPRIGNCYCPIQQQTPPSNLPWACPLQAQKQGIPEGVLFNFPQKNYSVPLTCMSSAYTPPPPPAPQIVECPYKTPQSVCTDFRKYGPEAMMFQEKLRRPCSFFSYDKKVGTSDQILYPKNNLCCCGTQSTTITADQQVENTNRVDDTDCKNKLNVFPWESNKINREECFCFPKLDSDEIRCAPTGKKEERRKDLSSFSQQNQWSNSEENICYKYYDDTINRCNASKTCLKKYAGFPNDNRNPKKCVSFSFLDNTLSISEKKQNENNDVNTRISDGLLHQPVKPQTTTQFKKPLIYRSSNISQKDSSEELNKDRYQCDIIRQITCLKRKRKGLIRMYSFFNDNLNDSLSNIDNEIEDLRGLCQGNSRKKTIKVAPQCRGISRLGEGYEELGNLQPKNEKPEDFKSDILNSTEDILFSPPSSPVRPQKQNSSDRINENTKDLTSEKISIANKQEDPTNSSLRMQDTNTEAQEAVDARILLDRIFALAESSGNLELANLQNENATEKSVEEAKHEDAEKREVNDSEIVNENLRSTVVESDYLKKYIYLNKDTKARDSITENEDILNLRRNAISSPAKTVEVVEQSSSEANKASTSFSCTKGLQSCVPGCKVRQSIEGKEEDSGLIVKRATTTYPTDTKPEGVEKKPIVNVSPDEFSEIGKGYGTKKTVRHRSEKSESQPITEDQGGLVKSIADTDKLEKIDEDEFTSIHHLPGTSKIEEDSRLLGPKLNQKISDVNKASCSKICDTTCYDETDGSSDQKIEKLEVQPILKSCTCSGNIVSRCGSSLYNLFAETLGKMRTIWQRGNTQQPQQCTPIRSNYREERDRFSPVFINRTSRISQDRFGTNKFCGRTRYDVNTNQWYSCCSREDNHVIQITFRETAEQRSVLLTDGCRNSRFFVVYE